MDAGVKTPGKFAPLRRPGPLSAKPLVYAGAAALGAIVLLLFSVVLRFSLAGSGQRKREERMYRAVQEVKDKAQISNWGAAGRPGRPPGAV